jgi:Asp-tRNA(Asn)/Glu-tRNA(Gln) amidotransferase A subunit family amidase
MSSLFLTKSIGVLIEGVTEGVHTPEEILSEALTTIRAHDTVGAWECVATDEEVHVAAEVALTETANQNLLKHMPVGIKDIYNTVDFPTQMGSPLWKDFTPGNDARAVFNTKRQGAIVIGKTVTAEFAVHALNKTKNPWDVTRTPGTSSSGSAAAVSLGMVPFATGSQTAGSIVRPASFCGVYGCKPSFGTIPRTGTLKTTDSLDTLGYFVAHAEDLRRGFDALRADGLDYPISFAALHDTARQTKPTGRPWRVGFVRTHTWEQAPEYARAALEGFMQQLASSEGVEVVDAQLPQELNQAHTIHETIYNKSLSYYFKNEHRQAEFVSPIMHELIEKGKQTSLEDYTKAIDAQMDLLYVIDDALASYDVIISLSTAGEAPLREETEIPDPSLMWTLCHLPVVSVPKFSSPSGLPFGFQVASRKYNDYLLFAFIEHVRKQGLIPDAAGFALTHE